MRRIAIVGGGPGGLLTASLLREKDDSLEITLFEAGPRLGGKILTKTFESYPAQYEAGVAELYNPKALQDPLLKKIKDFGLALSKMGGDAAIYNGKIIPNTEALQDIFGPECWKSFNDFMELGKKYRSPEQFAKAGWPCDNNHPWTHKTLREVLDKYITNEHAKRFYEVITKSDLATEPSVTNGAYGFDNGLVDDPEYCQIYTINQGIESLIDGLVSELDGKLDIRLNSPIRSLRALDNEFRVTYQREENIIAEKFDAVLICLPVQWLSSIEFIGDLRAPMAKHYAHYYHPGHYLRVACLFDTPFWTDALGDGSFFRLDAFGGCCVYNEGSRYDAGPHGVLNWLLAGSNAEALANSDDDTIIEKVLNSLPGDLGKRAKAEVREAKVHRWIGSVNGQPGGSPIESIEDKHLISPEHPNLLVVGDYLFDSTINGVLDSAEIATHMLLQNRDRAAPVRSNPAPRYPLSPRIKKLWRK